MLESLAKVSNTLTLSLAPKTLRGFYGEGDLWSELHPPNLSHENVKFFSRTQMIDFCDVGNR